MPALKKGTYVYYVGTGPAGLPELFQGTVERIYAPKKAGAYGAYAIRQQMDINGERPLVMNAHQDTYTDRELANANLVEICSTMIRDLSHIICHVQRNLLHMKANKP